MSTPFQELILPPMPGHATVLNLVQSVDTDEKELCERLGVESITFLSGKEIRDKGTIDGLNHAAEVHRSSGSRLFAIYCPDWSRQPRRHIAYLLACIASKGKRAAVDRKNRKIPLSWQGFIFSELPIAIRDYFRGVRLLAKTRLYLDEEQNREVVRRKISRGGARSIAYLRTDLWYDIKAGGSVGHVAGVINGFGKNGVRVHVLSWEEPAMLDSIARFNAIEPVEFLTSEREFALLAYNDQLINSGIKIVTESRPDAVYARYSLDCFAPVEFSRRLNIPLIIEYNGSEVWIEKNWGRGLLYPDLSQKIEYHVLKNADLITVVSKPLKDELTSRGIEEKRILVNPNSVDPSMFNPDRYSSDFIAARRRELKIPQDSVVAGFIGTFSPWHGVEVLAEAIPKAVEKCPNLHFLLIGSGPLIDDIKNLLENSGAIDRTTFTGIIPQDQAPKYLMCADFFLSPHVPNPDGTPFFGSPTKLFEYMALGKGIIASNLEQIGEIITDCETGILVPPGDSDALADAIISLCENPELGKQFGDAARKVALSKHTWKDHASRILNALYEL